MRTTHRTSVAVAMTIVTVIMTAFSMIWSRGDDMTLWGRMNHFVLFLALLAGATRAWQALAVGCKPSQWAPTIASLVLFINAVAILLCLIGAEASAGAVQIPEPAGTVLFWVMTVCAAYAVGMGFWLVKHDD